MPYEISGNLFPKFPPTLIILAQDWKASGYNDMHSSLYVIMTCIVSKQQGIVWLPSHILLMCFTPGCYWHNTEVLCTYQLVPLVELTIYGNVYRKIISDKLKWGVHAGSIQGNISRSTPHLTWIANWYTPPLNLRRGVYQVTKTCRNNRKFKGNRYKGRKM